MVLEIVITVGFSPIFLIYQIGEISKEYVEIESNLRTYSSENLHVSTLDRCTSRTLRTAAFFGVSLMLCLSLNI